MTTIPQVSAAMSEEQRAIFYAEMGAYGKDEVVGVLLALFLGSFGAHQFYLGRTGLGVLYLLFSWTGIPGLLGVVECFFMPGRVRRYNLERAMLVAGTLRGGVEMVPAVARHCSACGTGVAPGVRFCGRCGAPVA